MASDDILSRLPEAPPPAPEAKHAAIASALQRFDQKNSAPGQGAAHDLRLTQQTAASTPPSRRRFAMVREHQLVAAVFVVGLVGAGIALTTTSDFTRPQLYAPPPQPTQQASSPQATEGPVVISRLQKPDA